MYEVCEKIVCYLYYSTNPDANFIPSYFLPIFKYSLPTLAFPSNTSIPN